MDIVHEQINRYLGDLLPAGDPVLTGMEQYARERDFPIVGPLVGRLLRQLAGMTRATRIFEMGSGFGYSAFWFARGTTDDATIYCTDGSAANARLAGTYFRRGGIGKVEFLVGNALQLIDGVDGEFDIIFNDIDKHQYPDAFGKAVPRLRRGGLLISDNVLWSGRVVSGEPDADTAGIREYNRKIYGTEGLFTTIIPLRDGVSITMRL